jgi:hypothetical protein
MRVLIIFITAEDFSEVVASPGNALDRHWLPGNTKAGGHGWKGLHRIELVHASSATPDCLAQ